MTPRHAAVERLAGLLRWNCDGDHPGISDETFHHNEAETLLSHPDAQPFIDGEALSMRGIDVMTVVRDGDKWRASAESWSSGVTPYRELYTGSGSTPAAAITAAIKNPTQ